MAIINRMPRGETKVHLWGFNLVSAKLYKLYFPDEGKRDVLDIMSKCYGPERNFCNRKIELEKLFPEEFLKSKEMPIRSSLIAMDFINDNGKYRIYDAFNFWTG